MTNLEDRLHDQIEQWVSEFSLESTDEVASAIAETNCLFNEEYCEGVELRKIDNKQYQFECHVKMTGEPREDALPFYGDTINVVVEGYINFDEETGEWVIDNDYEILAETNYDPDPEYLEYLDKVNEPLRNGRLKKLSIENFKGIGSSIDIDLKPVTLLFGPNSAGKSSILHAIHCAQTILETGNADIEQTLLGGDIDLGGYSNYVHDHDLENPVVFGFNFEPNSDSDIFELVDSLKQTVKDVGVELTVQWSPLLNRPIVTRYAVAFEGKPFAEIACSLDGAQVWITNIHLDNPVLGNDLEEDETKLIDDKISCLPGRRMALPRFDESLGIEKNEDDYHFNDALEGLLIDAGSALRDLLLRFRYLGPIRQAPPRNYIPPKHDKEERWANGLGAWDAIAKNESLCMIVNFWLNTPETLDTGYRIDWVKFRELDEATFNRMMVASANSNLDNVFNQLTAALPESGRLVITDEKKDLKLAPEDLGEGIAQVVPVITAALSESMTTSSGQNALVQMVAIEQPELHIHPRMQVVLGDLFLSEASERQFLIETHSEHLMLRLLRRIRETKEKNLPAGLPKTTGDTISVLYVEQQNGEVQIRPLRFDDDGDFIDPWPGGFFDERFEEQY